MAVDTPLPDVPADDDAVRRWCEPGLRHFAEQDVLIIAMAVATDVVAHMLGSPWLRKGLSGGKGESRFLSLSEQGDEARFQTRLTDIAEMLVNVQHAGGFSARLREMRTSGIEDVVSELECAKYMHGLGWSYSFVERTGSLGSDYDLDVILPCGASAAVEVKCKLEATECTPTTIMNSLSHARTQLPKDRPGIVFLRIPVQWMTKDENAEILDDAVVASLRRTRRITSLFCHWEAYGTVAGKPARAHIFKHFWNQAASFQPSSLRGDLKRHPARPWRLLHDVVPEIRGAYVRYA